MTRGPCPVTLERRLRARGEPADMSNRSHPAASTPTFLAQAQAAALAKAAHELRTPLMAMGLTAELLSEELDHLARPDVRQLVATLHRNTVWLHQLVENLHEFAALGQKTGALACAPVDLRAVLHETERVLGPLLAAKDQRLEVLVPAALPLVPAARQLLGQVYLNLLGNASKFAPAGSLIRVPLIRTEGGVRVAVEDRGPGFPASAAVQLFDPFFQTPTPTAPGQRGVGLGLAIVRDIVQAHGGQAGAENRRGGGARVWFELPLHLPSAPTLAGGLE
jgi:signal transduction histidine kinase